MKIPLLNSGLKSSIFKAGFRVSALHFFVNPIAPIAFRRRAHSDKCLFKLPYSRINTCYAVGRRIGALNFHATRVNGKVEINHLHIHRP